MKRRPLLKRDIEIAYANSDSAAGAARFLKVSFKTFKKYAKMYKMYSTNQGGKGVNRNRKRGEFGLNEILEGRRPKYSPRKLRDRLIRAGILPNCCALCGYKESRIDGRVPLTFYYHDGNRRNYKLDNLELRCYNCTYLTTGYVNMKDVGDIRPDTYEEDLLLATTDDNTPLNFEELQKEAQHEMEKNNE